MDTRERGRDERKTREGWPGMLWCGSDAETGWMAHWCGGVRARGNGRSMMGRCAAMCRWFPLLPLILGIALLLMGYYLDASVTRVLWMFMAGSVALMGLFGLIVAGRMKKMCCGMS